MCLLWTPEALNCFKCTLKLHKSPDPVLTISGCSYWFWVFFGLPLMVWLALPQLRMFKSWTSTKYILLLVPFMDNLSGWLYLICLSCTGQTDPSATQTLSHSLHLLNICRPCSHCNEVRKCTKWFEKHIEVHAAPSPTWDATLEWCAGLHKTWYPGNGVTSQSRFLQPKWLTGPEAQPAILPGHPANIFETWKPFNYLASPPFQNLVASLIKMGLSKWLAAAGLGWSPSQPLQCFLRHMI